MHTLERISLHTQATAHGGLGFGAWMLLLTCVWLASVQTLPGALSRVDERVGVLLLRRRRRPILRDCAAAAAGLGWLQLCCMYAHTASVWPAMGQQLMCLHARRCLFHFVVCGVQRVAGVCCEQGMVGC